MMDSQIEATFVYDIDDCKVIRVYENGVTRPFVSSQNPGSYYGLDFKEGGGSDLEFVCEL